MDAALLRKHYPFESKFLELGHGRMHYIDEGFRNLVKDLRATHRCIALDHIGMGLSDKPGDDRYEYTLERRVADLETLLEKLGLKDGVTFVLHDWGGMIGLAAAVRDPRRVSRLVMMNTAGFLLPPGGMLPWQLKLTRSPLGEVLVRGFNAFAAGAAKTCVTKAPMSAEVSALFTAPYGSWTERISTLRFVQDIPLGPTDRAWAVAKATQDGLDTLKSVPKLVCWGEKDFVFDAKFLAEWRRRCPEAEVQALVKAFLSAHPLQKVA
ncbi:MAG: haloalkane dehalogenase [Elusimicrobia bacterium]|nr:MAG: haloalkane dehalogenase [Elusimicrobiota bacterium]